MNKKYISSLFKRVLISIIVFLLISILCTKSDKFLLIFKDNVYDKSMNFSYFKKIYGFIDKDVLVSKISYTSYNAYMDGAELYDVQAVYPFKSGTVVYIGQKDDYGKTVIIEALDGICYLYGNLDNISVKLYDYIESDNVIADALDNKLYVVFMKDNLYLNYEEFI